MTNKIKSYIDSYLIIWNTKNRHDESRKATSIYRHSGKYLEIDIDTFELL